MSDKNELDSELERATAELERKRKEVPARQAIRNRLAIWQQEDVLHREKFQKIQSDCNHPEMRQTGRVRDEKNECDSPCSVAAFTCQDCGLVKDKYV